MGECSLRTVLSGGTFGSKGLEEADFGRHEEMPAELT